MKPEDLFQHQCRVNPDYFFDKCVVTTCKNYSGVVESRCLAADRKDCLNSERGMSDHEIRFFKQYPSIKQVTRNRKQAFNSVYAILILDKYIEYLDQMRRVDIDPAIMNDRQVASVLAKYPLNVQEFTITPSLLYYLFDEATYSAFSVRTCKMCNEYSLSAILGIDQPVLAALAAKVKSSERSKT